MGEFSLKKNPCLKEQTLTIGKDGNLTSINDFGNISSDRNDLKVGKTPYFLKISKIREIIYMSE